MSREVGWRRRGWSGDAETMVCETVEGRAVERVRAAGPGPGGLVESSRRQPGKRGPKTALSDDELLQEIRTVLKSSPFLGEGHRKVEGAAPGQGDTGGQEPGAKADAGARAAGASAAGLSSWRPDPQRPDPDRMPAERGTVVRGVDIHQDLWQRGGGPPGASRDLGQPPRAALRESRLRHRPSRDIRGRLALRQQRQLLGEAGWPAGALALQCRPRRARPAPRFRAGSPAASHTDQQH